MNPKDSQKGVAIYLALMVTIILLAIGLGISTIIVSQMVMIREMGDSVGAFYAAETGVERVLYEDKQCRTLGCGDLTFCAEDNTSCDKGRSSQTNIPSDTATLDYTVNFTNNVTEVEIQSRGSYKGTRRAIEATME
jgi:Tfp pilus assembly protein PilX